MALTPLQLFQAMRRLRRIEEVIAERYRAQDMRCPMHLCIGQEATSVGICAALSVEDKVFSGHRAHGHYLAKGGSLKAMIAELYGRTTGCCGGRGGSMHLIDQAVGFMGSTAIVGGTVPLAVGAAWAAKLQKHPWISTIFLGDGCFEQGVVHEAMNFAALHALPIIFACENNQLSCYTHQHIRQPKRPIYKIAEAHGLKALEADGNDVIAIQDLATQARHACLQGEGPWFLELHTYRWREHCGPDFDHQLGYRTQEEIIRGEADCPILRLQSTLAAQIPSFEQDLAVFEQAVHTEIEAAFEFALTSPCGSPLTAGEKLYA